MKILGILTVPTKKTEILRKLRKSIRFRETFTAYGTTMMVAELPFSQEESLRLPLWYRERCYKKGEKFLLHMGCSRVIAEEVGSGNDNNGLIIPIPQKAMYRCLNWLLENELLVLPKHIQLSFASVKEIENSFLQFLCRNSNRLDFHTEDQKNAETLCEKICEKYGFYPNLQDGNRVQATDVLRIDLVRGVIRLGTRVLADGMEVISDLHGYRIQVERIWNGISDCFQDAEFVSWTRGKKRLTRE